MENQGKAKNRGMIFHLAHLPAKGSAIGQFNDPETVGFIEFLAESRQTHWIIQPLTPFGDDLSPYNSSSRFDRNVYFINLNQLATDEYDNLLKSHELPDDLPLNGFSLNILRAQKDSKLKLAYERFKELKKKSNLYKEYKAFCEEEGENWLDMNSIYEGIIPQYGYDWRYWPEKLKFLPEKTSGKSFKEKLTYAQKHGLEENKLDIINQFRFTQFLFNKQFKEFKKMLDDKNIKLFVDLAYAISPNGKDVWARKEIVELHEDFSPKRVTGCPPEIAYPHTQRWGQAVWNYESDQYWEYQEISIRQLLKEGCVRLDHFGGLINRAAIPTRVERDGHLISGDEIFKPTNQGGLGADYWEKEWLEDVSTKTSPKGETLIELYLRIASEEGLNPEDTFIVEDLGSVCATETFENFMIEYGHKLSGLRLPITYGIDLVLDGAKDINHKFNDSNPYNIKGGVKNVALLSGSHDPPALMEIIEKLLTSQEQYFDGGAVNSPVHFKNFCWHELGLPAEDIKDYHKVCLACLRWIYQKPARHAQTTISDALGIYFRPNIPGGYNGAKDKWEMKNTVEGLFNYWGKQFPKYFLKRDDQGGYTPGYKARAEQYVSLMQELYPN